MLHRDAPLSVEGRRGLVQRCQTRPISHRAEAQEHPVVGDVDVVDGEAADQGRPLSVGQDE
ncbi:hypothetical protein EP51_43855 (plasmid) [Rhodococcus opacus]|uniref:Uncharacterized protein n=1 Tax=Rhodococcus opacus TaxID=37919 RepID=A0A076F016_RHOOP|nr:hypothetical protein EP51_43855 [Rhodococcus opacus]